MKLQPGRGKCMLDSMDQMDADAWTCWKDTTMNDATKLIPSHGGYRKLKSFQLAQMAYDVTERLYRVRSQRKSRD